MQTKINNLIEKKTGDICRHKNLMWEECFDCGSETAWCEKCYRDVGRKLNQKQAKVL